MNFGPSPKAKPTLQIAKDNLVTQNFKGAERNGLTLTEKSKKLSCGQNLSIESKFEEKRP